MASQWPLTLPYYPPDEMSPDNAPEPWIAIEPVARNPGDDGLVTSSRFLNLSSDFEFAGWGSFARLKLTTEDHTIGEERLQNLRRARLLGQFTGTALPGNAVLGSVFYALPAVVAVSGVYSPISLFVATLTPFLWRPIMEELASALPISGAPYSYMYGFICRIMHTLMRRRLNASRKSLALLGAALLLLDFASTSVVSAATATSYLGGEVVLPFPEFVGAALVLLVFALVSLTGLKESARIAFVVLSFHIATMVALGLAGSVHWAQSGNAQLRRNWTEGQAPTGAAIARQLFNGFCLGMLGLTGIECSPSYIGRMKPGRFPSVLRNLHLPAIILNTLMLTLVLATVPLETVLAGANVLSVLAETAAGSWLRTWIVVDAAVVLCGGVLTGILSACELFAQLAHDRIVPQAFLKLLPLSGAPYISVFTFTVINAVLYASAGANLAIVSKMFSLVWLTVMSLFPLALLLLRFNRGRLPRERNTPLWIIALTLALTPVVFAGNIVIDPSTGGYFAVYLIGVLAVFTATQNKVGLLRAVYWAYDQYPALHRFGASRAWGAAMVRMMARLKRQPVCILVKTDEINHLLHMLLYVRENEETSCVKIVHFSDAETGIPSELEANAKILDEAFPEITIDLIVVQGAFAPAHVVALAHRLQIPPALMFMSCPGPCFAHPIAEFGTRIISL
ncbi:AAAP amino acid permease [Mycena rosella]|uniref:AAAP amino acid permease n=1 Tax=Mycena rosella TaxID=1033263 RepID=A0AAD7CM75_MYCRO|nr:AAAP amino acid permease [Mycena rosella]